MTVLDSKMYFAPMNRMLLSFFFFFLLSCGELKPQDENIVNMDGVECGLHGSSAPDKKEYELNVLKNRYKFPDSAAMMPNITLQDLIKSGSSGDFPQDKAVILTGYIFNVKVGGVESCNCKTKDQLYRDTHIELVPDEEHTGPEYRLIVEVTPRLRALMAIKGQDWSTETLKHTIKGHNARVTGWLFYDSEHERETFATNPGGSRNWRSSCWEIHPITNIELLD